MESATLDLLRVNSDGSTQSVGDVASRLLQANMDIGALRTNDVLRRDEWKDFDDVLIEISQKELRGVADLVAAGNVYSLRNPLGRTRIEWERINDMLPAEVSMSGVTTDNARQERVTFDNQSLPVPIIYKDFNMNVRFLAATRERGEPVDTTQMRLATRIVNEGLEKMLFKGARVEGEGSVVYGYTNYPGRRTMTIAKPWTSKGVTGSEILEDIIKFINDLQIGGLSGEGAETHQNNMPGPYIMYMPQEWYMALMEDFKANSDKSILSRLREIPTISDYRPIRLLDNQNELVLVQMTSDVVDWVDGLQPTVTQWDSPSGMVSHFKVMSIGVPRMKSTKYGQCGILHVTVA